MTRRDPGGYHPQHREMVRAAWRGGAWVVGVTGMLAATTGAAAIFLRGSLVLAAAAGAVFVFGLLLSIAGVVDTCRHARIIPFFPRRVGGTDTFLHGQALVRYFQPLEALANAAGVCPLSTFGFPDPLRGQPVKWHAAAAGLETVRGLIGQLEPNPHLLGDVPAVLQDLRRLEQALSLAAAADIPFSLLLLHGDTTSGLEWERRGGEPF